jgi:hypothetical protein
VRGYASSLLFLVAFALGACASVPRSNCKFGPDKVGVITANVAVAVAALETSDVTYRFEVPPNGELFRIRATGHRIEGWPFSAADDLTDVNGMCWVYLGPASRRPGVQILDGEGAAIINPKTLAVAKVTWFRY